MPDLNANGYFSSLMIGLLIKIISIQWFSTFVKNLPGIARLGNAT